LFTVSVAGAEPDARKALAPLYAAVRLCVPAAKDADDQLACPDEFSDWAERLEVAS
jgi:hypothetical protein